MELTERKLPRVAYEDMPRGYMFSPPNTYNNVHPIHLGKYLICHQCRKNVYMVEIDHPAGWRQGPWYVQVSCHDKTERLTISRAEIDAIMADVDNARFRPMWVFTLKLASASKKLPAET